MSAGADGPALARKAKVIAHRGASALRPEHTLAAYAQAIADGADSIEPDLVLTRDGVLVARHENEISSTTDVAAHGEFAARQTRKIIDGETLEGWFVEDFTLAELKTLRARERLPQLRSTAYDGRFEIPSLQEIIELLDLQSGGERVVGMVPELKHSSYFAGLGLPMEDRLLDMLARHAYTRHAPVEIQSFEIGNLRYLRERLGPNHANVCLLLLLGEPHAQPWDETAAGRATDYAQMTTPPGLREIARYADAIGPWHRHVVPLMADETLGSPTALVADAHAAGLQVHAWTFRPENQFLPRSLWSGEDPATTNTAGAITEIRACLDAGIDAFFTDSPAIGRQAVDLR